MDPTFATVRRAFRTEAGRGCALDASSEIRSPVFATGPFADGVRLLDLDVRERPDVDLLVVFLADPFRLRDDPDVLDAPFLLFDLVALEPLRPERAFER